MISLEGHSLLYLSSHSPSVGGEATFTNRLPVKEVRFLLYFLSPQSGCLLDGRPLLKQRDTRRQSSWNPETHDVVYSTSFLPPHGGILHFFQSPPPWGSRAPPWPPRSAPCTPPARGLHRGSTPGPWRAPRGCGSRSHLDHQTTKNLKERIFVAAVFVVLTMGLGQNQDETGELLRSAS